MRFLSYWVLRALGWRFDGQLPPDRKLVVLGAPHTSNWDFILFLGALHHFRRRVKFLGKHTLFKKPMGWIFTALGGIPVNRQRAGGIVGQAVDAFDSADDMILVLAPEGTRKATSSWRSGFLEIARGASVPIIIGGVDGANRVVAISPPLDPHRPDLMDGIRDFLDGKLGLKPEGRTPVMLRSELES